MRALAPLRALHSPRCEAIDDPELLQSIRERVRNSIYAQIAELKGIRAADPGRYPPTRLRKAVGRQIDRMAAAVREPFSG